MLIDITELFNNEKWLYCHILRSLARTTNESQRLKLLINAQKE